MRICCTCHILSNNACYAETSLKLHLARSRLRLTFGDRRKRGSDASECRARNGEGVHTVHLAVLLLHTVCQGDRSASSAMGATRHLQFGSWCLNELP